MMQQSQGKINQSLKSPPPKEAIKIFSPTVKYVSHDCLNRDCQLNTEKHFCSIPCQAAWYEEWKTNTPYLMDLETQMRIQHVNITSLDAKVTNDKRLIDYKSYLALESWDTNTVTTTT